MKKFEITITGDGIYDEYKDRLDEELAAFIEIRLIDCFKSEVYVNEVYVEEEEK